MARRFRYKVLMMRRPSVLYFDDEAMCLEVFRQTFGDEYGVSTALTLEEARAALNARRFDVIISDQSMPEIDGAMFLREAARLSPTSFRVLLTGNANISHVLAELSGGVIHQFATKPWAGDLMLRIAERAGLI